MSDTSISASDWIGRALAHPGQSRWADVPGNRIHYLEWQGPPDAPGILLVHGYRAHAHWWDFTAPLLAKNFRVLAMDMGGMGDSGYRAVYSQESYVEEIAGVLRHAQLRNAALIGHSFGGLMGIGACHRFPELIARAVIIDSRISFPDDDVRNYRPTQRPKKRYATLTDALQHFRLVPDQGGVAATLFDYVAKYSIKQDGDAWMWKFDDAHTAPDVPIPPMTEGEMLEQAKMPIDFICGELSAIVPPELAQRIGKSLKHGRGPIVIPDAYHHVLLDQPLALVAALRALLAV